MIATVENTLETLSPKHQQALSLRFQGNTYESIAKILGFATGSVRHWFATGGLLHEAYEEYTHRTLNPIVPAGATHTEARAVAYRIKELASPASEEVARVLHHAKYDDTRLSAAKDILDRAGYMPVQKMLNVHAVEEMSIDQLDSFIGGILAKETKSPKSPKNIASNSPAIERLSTDPCNHTGDVAPDVASTIAPIYKEADSSIDVPDMTHVSDASITPSTDHDISTSVGTE